MVYCIGNNNYDIFFDKEQVVAGAPGGSMLNVSVSLGRMGVPVQFITRVGDDRLAETILKFLRDNGVGVDYITALPGKKTSLALAVLDDDKKPAYSFYGTKEPAPGFERVTFVSQDILLFGSSYAIDDYTTDAVDRLITDASEAGAVRIYDPNIRNKCASSIRDVTQRVLRRMHAADIIKMSDEDLAAVELDADQLTNQMPGKTFVITKGAQAVQFRRGEEYFQVPVAKIKPVNTTGAGDAFNAGLIEALCEKKISSAELPELKPAFWKQAISKGIAGASRVCLSNENYLPKPTP